MSKVRNTKAKSASAKARKIAAEGENIRERTRRAFTDAVSSRRFGFDAISDVAKGMIDGAANAVKSAAPKEKASVLKEVIDGLADGFSSSAHAARLALKDAKGHGETFVKKDVKRVTDNLRVLEEVFFETVSQAVDRAQDQLGSQAHDLQKHARRAATQMRPALEKAIHAAMDHPGELISQSASAGAKAAPRAAGALLQAMSGLLAGAGDLLLRGDSKSAGRSATSHKKKKKKKKTKKKAARKKAAKKTARKKSSKKKVTKKTARTKAGKKAASKKKSSKKTAKRSAKK